VLYFRRIIGCSLEDCRGKARSIKTGQEAWATWEEEAGTIHVGKQSQSRGIEETQPVSGDGC
jgi:hypothetical protein